MRKKRRIAAAVVFLALPVPLYFALLAIMRANGSATVILGAASGSSTTAIVVAVVALLLRIYTVVALPAVLTYLGVMFAWRLLRARAAK